MINYSLPSLPVDESCESDLMKQLIALRSSGHDAGLAAPSMVEAVTLSPTLVLK